MHKRVWDHVALSATNNILQLADGANALAAYTRKHGDALGFAIAFNYSADADATYAIKLTECDTVGGVYTDVASDEMSGDTGTFTQAQLAALSPANVAQVNYHGKKSFVKVHITTANITDNVNTVYTRVVCLALESGLKKTTGNQ